VKPRLHRLGGCTLALSAALLAGCASTRSAEQTEHAASDAAIKAFRARYPTEIIGCVEASPLGGFNPYETWPRVYSISTVPRGNAGEIDALVAEDGKFISTTERTQVGDLPPDLRRLAERESGEPGLEPFRFVTFALPEYVLQPNTERRFGLELRDGDEQREMILDENGRVLRDTEDPGAVAASAEGSEAQRGSIALEASESDHDDGDSPRDDVLRAIASALRTRFPGEPEAFVGTAHWWDGYGGNFLVCYTADAGARESLVTERGELLHTSIELAIDRLPSSVRAEAERRHPGATIESASAIETQAVVRYRTLAEERSTYLCWFREGDIVVPRCYRADGSLIGAR
jgi:hypothetical protein